MKLAAKKNKILSAIMTCVLAITLMAGFPAVKAYAASGTAVSYTHLSNCCFHKHLFLLPQLLLFQSGHLSLSYQQLLNCQVLSEVL